MDRAEWLDLQAESMEKLGISVVEEQVGLIMAQILVFYPDLKLSGLLPKRPKNLLRKIKKQNFTA